MVTASSGENVVTRNSSFFKPIKDEVDAKGRDEADTHDVDELNRRTRNKSFRHSRGTEAIPPA